MGLEAPGQACPDQSKRNPEESINMLTDKQIFKTGAILWEIAHHVCTHNFTSLVKGALFLCHLCILLITAIQGSLLSCHSMEIRVETNVDIGPASFIKGVNYFRLRYT